MEPTLRGLIPLSAAALCLNDETVFHVTDGQCPMCASEHFALVATWVPISEARTP